MLLGHRIRPEFGSVMGGKGQDKKNLCQESGLCGAVSLPQAVRVTLSLLPRGRGGRVGVAQQQGHVAFVVMQIRGLILMDHLSD